MTPKQLERIGRRVWGGRWKSPLARAIGMSYIQINAYMNRRFDIPRTVELAVKYLDANPDEARELGLSERERRQAARELD